MGGAAVVLAGDFRQTLPIVTRGTPADQINACLKYSYLWHHVKKFSLTLNMQSHIQGNLSAGQLQTSCSRLQMVKFLKILNRRHHYDCDKPIRNFITNLLRRLF
ncbi:ATP-dependent DNA helicase [Trichonephila clavipes]|nr:ATP-dependent DNA helicase [Trichonephila clavipes]